MSFMFSCCGDSKNLMKDFNCKVEKTDKGLNISIEGNDPKKVEALKKMFEASQDLCSEDGKSCC